MTAPPAAPRAHVRVGPADSIEGVIERMRAIHTSLPPGDGVWDFNRMYLTVTEQVRTAVAGTTFKNAKFLAYLDVVFANLYFAAVDADAAGSPVPAAWSPLFECRDRPHTHPIQFAFAGMNAHINHDLGLAVVQACADLGLVPADESPQHIDFRTTNEILSSLMPSIKASFEAGLALRIDADARDLDDAFERWGIARLRDAAWDTGRLVWSLREHPRAHALFLTTLARSVEAAGHGLLI